MPSSFCGSCISQRVGNALSLRTSGPKSMIHVEFKPRFLDNEVPRLSCSDTRVPGPIGLKPAKVWGAQSSELGADVTYVLGIQQDVSAASSYLPHSDPQKQEALEAFRQIA